MASATGQAGIDVGQDRLGNILRDIVRGGLAGTITGAVVAGLGGRVVMRLAALAVPTSVGRFTENGNRIGEITLGGSLALILLGLFIGLFIGAIWVAVAPWIPGTGLRRALVAMPIAVALGAVGLVDGGNADFIVLRRDPVVVALLVALVALVGFVVSMIDDGLDKWLPQPAGGPGGVAGAYAALAAIGVVVTLPLVLTAFFFGGNPRVLMGVALVACGLATLQWWRLRVRGITDPPRRLALVGRASLVAVVILGAIETVPEIRMALGVY